ncbi:uncharacterized protein SOCE26_011180 [Sorangium cellulosum]|uniref:Autotransporter domain-containing protein n=1 Tax=Sorangium cellulosum TaxID=56 RepID=A0A2L0EK98_SORCE|nr:hypothetical protein [Sorangium cellulosum]AUX39723.1 uncharacterized protein SOCE26_011180 [Sorangium cellulosum]
MLQTSTKGLATAVGLALCLGSAEAHAQRVDLGGTVRCGPSKEPAQGVVVLIEDVDAKPQTTAKNGYFRFSWLRYHQVVDRPLKLQYWSGARDDPKTEPFYVDERRLVWQGTARYYPAPSHEIAANCAAIDTKAANVAAQAASSNHEGAVAVPVLDFFSKILMFFGAGGPGDPWYDRITKELLPVNSVSPNTKLGGLLARARTTQFLSPGFRYAPGRDALSALVTNAAALGFAEGWEVLTNSDIHVPAPYYLSVGLRWGQGHGWGVGFGYYFQADFEDRSFTFGQGETDDILSWSHEHAFVLAVSRPINHHVSLALSGKFLLQTDSEPTGVMRTHYFYQNEEVDHTDDIMTATRVTSSGDLGVSLAYDPIPQLRLGLSVQNILGRNERWRGGEEGDRAIGLGVTSYLGRVRLGTDIEYAQLHGLNFSTGLSVNVASWLELGAGYVSTERTLRSYFRLFGAMLSLRTGDDRWGVNASARWRF